MTPLGEYKKEADRAFAQFKGALLKVPDRERIKLFPLFQSVEVYWRTYAQAVERKEDHVTGEIWRRRRGPRGKSLEELLEEQVRLQNEINALLKRQEEENLAGKDFLKLVRPLNARLFKIEEKLARDYG